MVFESNPSKQFKRVKEVGPVNATNGKWKVAFAGNADEARIQKLLEDWYEPFAANNDGIWFKKRSNA